MADKVEEIRSEVAHCALKISLARHKIAYVEGEVFRIEDRELCDMLSEAQGMCNKICAYINLRREPSAENREYYQRILDREL